MPGSPCRSKYATGDLELGVPEIPRWQFVGKWASGRAWAATMISHLVGIAVGSQVIEVSGTLSCGAATPAETRARSPSFGSFPRTQNGPQLIGSKRMPPADSAKGADPPKAASPSDLIARHGKCLPDCRRRSTRRATAAVAAGGPHSRGQSSHCCGIRRRCDRAAAKARASSATPSAAGSDCAGPPRQNVAEAWHQYGRRSFNRHAPASACTLNW